MEHNNDPAAAAASVDHDAHAGLRDDLMARVAPCLARRETRLTCRDMVNGLLSELEDHNCWTLAGAAGHLTAGQDEGDVVLIVDETADEKSSAGSVAPPSRRYGAG